MSGDIATLAPDGGLDLHFHRGQWRAWLSEKRVVAVISGARGGKTSFGPYWLYREVQARGPGDYLVVAPTYPLLSKAALPNTLRLFQQALRLGEYKTQAKAFVFSAEGQRRTHGGRCDRPTQVFFCYATDPDSLEAATAKAAWLDEAGQSKFRLGSWEAIQRRVSVDRGRVLITTTPYDLGWLKQKVHDPWRAAGGDHPEIDLIRFDSTANPAFPPEEMEKARRELPAWRFNMMMRGEFERPAGLVYDCFDGRRHVEPAFRVPEQWPRFVGLDFGARNTAAVFLARECDRDRNPLPTWHVYREHHPNEKLPTSAHVAAVMEGEPRMPTCVGGARAEDDWRAKFAQAGLPVRPPPLHGIEVGIDAVYGMIRSGELLVSESCHGLLDELASYSRVVDDEGQVGEKIDSDSEYHFLAALRYVCLHLKRGGGAFPTRRREDNRTMVGGAPPGVFGGP